MADEVQQDNAPPQGGERNLRPGDRGQREARRRLADQLGYRGRLHPFMLAIVLVPALLVAGLVGMLVNKK